MSKLTTMQDAKAHQDFTRIRGLKDRIRPFQAELAKVIVKKTPIISLQKALLVFQLAFSILIYSLHFV